MIDLREWLDTVDGLGELHRVKAEVDWNEEMAAVSYLAASQEGAPALLFEKVKGYPAGRRVLFNAIGTSLSRIAVAMGMAPGQTAMAMIREARERLKRRIEPVEVAEGEAPVNQNILEGDRVDVTAFPAPKMWPLDGGRYIGTADVIITRNPDTGVLNMGTYRQMIQDSQHVGLYLSPGKDAKLHLQRAWQQGKPLEVAACWGIDPLLLIIGSQGFPKNLCEYEFAGGVKGEPLAVVKGRVTDLLFPAHAEVVAEGIIRPESVRSEGPFGEFTGYYGRPEAETPLMEVQAIHHRNDPILTSALMADYPACEQSLFFSIIRSARVWDDLDRMGIPGIQGVYVHPAAAGGFGMLTVSIEQRFAGHAQQVAALAAQCPGGAYYTKWIVVVDEDVDPSDTDQVLWAMATRCNPVDDIDILRNTWSTWLDPTQNPPEDRPYGSKALINACKEHKYQQIFSRRTAITRGMYQRVRERWQELGLAGEPPEPRAFEDFQNLQNMQSVSRRLEEFSGM